MKKSLKLLLIIIVVSPLRTSWSFVIQDSDLYADGGGTYCFPGYNVDRYVSDFGIDREAFTGNACGGQELWKLLWSLSDLDEFRNVVRAPSSWINNLYQWVARRIDFLGRERNAGSRLCPTVTVLASNSSPLGSEKTMTICNAFFNKNVFYRMTILIHEARHSDAAGNYYPHVACQEGPNAGRSSCDQRFQRSGGGAWSFTVYPFAWLYYNGRAEEISPAVKDWAKNTANAILDDLFVEQPEYRLR